MDTTTRSWHREALLYLLCSAQMMILLDLSITNIVAPQLPRVLNISGQMAFYAISFYALPFGAFLIAVGRAGDLYDPRRLFIVGVLIFGVGSLFCGLGLSAEIFFGARLVQGVGSAFMAATALSLITTIFKEPAERNRAIGRLGAMAAVGGIVGLLVGGFVVDRFYPTFVYFINVLLGLIVIIAAQRLFKDTPIEIQKGQFDGWGALTLIMGLAFFLGALTLAQSGAFGSLPFFLCLFGSLLLLMIFGFVESRVPAPLLPLALLRIPTILAINGIGLLHAATIAGESFFISLYLQGILQYSGFATGLVLLLQNGAFLGGTLLGAPFLNRWGAQKVIVGTLLLAGFGSLVLAQITPGGALWLPLLTGLLLFGLGFGGALVAINSSATAAFPLSQQGLASGLINTSQQLGSAIGITVLVAIVTATTNSLGGGENVQNIIAGYQMGFAVAGGIAIVGAIGAWLLLARKGV